LNDVTTRQTLVAADRSSRPNTAARKKSLPRSCHTRFTLTRFKPRFSAVLFLSAEGCGCIAEDCGRVRFDCDGQCGSLTSSRWCSFDVVERRLEPRKCETGKGANPAIELQARSCIETGGATTPQMVA